MTAITDGQQRLHAAGPSRPFVRIIGLAALLLGAVILGVNATDNTTLVFAVIMLIAALPFVNGRPVTWIALAIIVVWTCRLVTNTGIAPRFLDFADFPLVLVAFLIAGLRFLSTGRRLPSSQRQIMRWLLIVTVVIALSWAFNDLTEPLRLVAGWTLAVEPFLLLAAVLLTPMTVRERSRLLILCGVLLSVQVVFSLGQYVTGATGDEIKGTLLGAGAGHHVSAAGAILGFILMARQNVPKVLLIGYGAAVLAVLLLADAKQVLFVVPLALLVLAVTGHAQRGSAVPLIGGILAGVLMAGAAVYGLLSYGGSTFAFNFIDDSVEDKVGKPVVAEALWNDITETPPGALFGLGPGQSVSRFAFLTTPLLLKEGSPASVLGLSVSSGAERYQDISELGRRDEDNSSFSSAQSSALGILGDYGIFGVLAFGGLIAAVLNALRRAPDRRLGASAFACWALLLPLAVIFDWLEQPPFTLAVMLITGLAMRSPRSLEPEPVRVSLGPSASPRSVSHGKACKRSLLRPAVRNSAIERIVARDD